MVFIKKLIVTHSDHMKTKPSIINEEPYHNIMESAISSGIHSFIQDQPLLSVHQNQPVQPLQLPPLGEVQGVIDRIDIDSEMLDMELTAINRYQIKDVLLPEEHEKLHKELIRLNRGDEVQLFNPGTWEDPLLVKKKK